MPTFGRKVEPAHAEDGHQPDCSQSLRLRQRREELLQVSARQPSSSSHDADGLLQVSNIHKGVSFKQKQVGSCSNGTRTKLLVLPEEDGWRNGGRANGLVRCEPALGQQFELAVE